MSSEGKQRWMRLMWTMTRQSQRMRPQTQSGVPSRRPQGLGRPDGAPPLGALANRVLPPEVNEPAHAAGQIYREARKE